MKPKPKVKPKAKTKKDIVKWLDRGLITSPYCFGLCQTEKAFERELRRLKVPHCDWPGWVKKRYDASTHFFETDSGNGLCCVVCIGSRKGRTINEVHCLLVHEAVHIWKEIKKQLGEKNASDEFEAYCIQSISLKLMDAYKR